MNIIGASALMSKPPSKAIPKPTLKTEPAAVASSDCLLPPPGSGVPRLSSSGLDSSHSTLIALNPRPIRPKKHDFLVYNQTNSLLKHHKLKRLFFQYMYCNLLLSLQNAHQRLLSLTQWHFG